jgi:hypothetical protein
MRIEKLELKNFRSHQVTQFLFDRVNVVRGLHAVGKSSVALAIEFILTGACAVTDTAGRGADQLLMDGANEFVITARIGLTPKPSDPGAVIQRSRNKAGGNFIIKAGQGDKKKNLVARQADAWIEEKIAPRQVLSAVLNAQRFFAMSDKDRKQLLTSALAADPVELPKDVQESLKQFLDDVPEAVNGPDDVEFYYKQLYELRREKNASRRDMGALEEPEKPEGMPSADETRKKLATVRLELGKLEHERATVTGNHAGYLRDLRRAEEDLKEHQPAILDEATMTELTRHAGKKEAAAMLDRKIADLQNFDIARINQQMHVLTKDPGNCPTCGKPMEKSDTSEQLNNLQHRLEIAQKDLEEAMAKREPLGDPAEAERKLAAHRRAIPKVAAAEKIIAELKGIQPTVDTSDYDAQIAPLKEKITRGEDVLTRINMFEGEMARYQVELRQRKELDEKLTRLEGLVKYFSPDGELRPLLVGGKLAGFNDAINQVLERFGFAATIMLDPFGMVVSTSPHISSPPRQLDQLSESEAFRFGVAFQIALAEATGVGIVVIDRADLLLPGVQKFLNQALMESKLDQAFILAAKEDLAIKVMPPAGVKIFDLDKDAKGRTQIAAVHGEAA